MDDKSLKISDALESLALALGENGAVPVAELVRALERAAERLRTRNAPTETPVDLVTQAEASRVVGVSRQAVNQWVRKGLLTTYVDPDTTGRQGPQVSLSEVAIAANRRTPATFSSGLRRELIEFIDLISDSSTQGIAQDIRQSLEQEWPSGRYADESRVLREFVIAAMDTGDRREFTADGVRLLADLHPQFEVDRTTGFGRLADSLGLLVTSSSGAAGFDSPVTAILGILGAATVGSRYAGDDAQVGLSLAGAAEYVWGAEWPSRLYDAAFHVGELRPSPLTRFTASLTYLDNNRFLRQAQSAGVSIAYSRGPGPILPQRFHGAPIHHDVLTHDRVAEPVWAFTRAAAEAVGRPVEQSSAVSPFRVFNYEYGLLDTSIHGIRRYCYSEADARDGLKASLKQLSPTDRQLYLRSATEYLARTLAQPQVELVAVEARENFDWWKDHVIRSSEREILIGLRDEEARRTAHALLVQTSMLGDVVEAASDAALRDRLRIYVKNLEFDVVEARYADDLRRGVARVVKTGGRTLSVGDATALAESILADYMR